MRRSSVLRILLALSLALVAAGPATPPGQLMTDLAGDANGINPHTHGIIAGGLLQHVPTGPAQVDAADLLAGRLVTRWSGNGRDRSVTGIEVRLRTGEASSKVPLEYSTHLDVDGCTLSIHARVGSLRMLDEETPKVTLWVGDQAHCGLARGRVYHDAQMVRAWDARTSELVVTVDTRWGPRAVRQLLRPGATVTWGYSTSAGPSPTRIVGALDLAFGGGGTWVIGR